MQSIVHTSSFCTRSVMYSHDKQTTSSSKMMCLQVTLGWLQIIKLKSTCKSDPPPPPWANYNILRQRTKHWCDRERAPTLLVRFTASLCRSTTLRSPILPLSTPSPVSLRSISNLLRQTKDWSETKDLDSPPSPTPLPDLQYITMDALCRGLTWAVYLLRIYGVC